MNSPRTTMSLAPGESALDQTLRRIISSRTLRLPPCLLALWASALLCHAERINQEGRILGSAPVVTTPTLFNTAQADTIVSAMQIFPLTNPWNEDISRRPVLSNSDAMIAQIITDLGASRSNLRLFTEMNFVLVPDNQSSVPVIFDSYPDESDPSPYPIPSNMPVETWPVGTGNLTLQQWQMDVNGDGGDRHSIIAQPGSGFIWETWQALLVGTSWHASNGAKFDLKSNALRPSGWTSGDAAGLPMFPALVRFDECQRGMVEHAMRLVVKRTRVGPIYPATHQASVGNQTNPNIPAMGQRVRLKSGFTIPATWSKEEKAVLLGLKKYGAIVADNGNFFSISITPDDRYSSSAFSHISSVNITNFEVIQTTGPSEGPRSAGAPSVDAGSDRTVGVGSNVQLSGFVTWTNTVPAIRWTNYSGAGAVVFGDSTKTNTTVSFSTAGKYTLMLSADDGVHAVARDAVVIDVVSQFSIAISRSGPDARIDWFGGSSPYVLEATNDPATNSWGVVSTNTGTGVTVPISANAGYFRVRCPAP